MPLAPGRGDRPGPVVAVWALLLGIIAVPYCKAAAAPPPGHTFVGVFFYADDFYNYLSYVRQAEEGRFFFVNKLRPGTPANVVNLEWWGVGRLSALLGGRPVLAYHLVGLAAAFALLAAVDRWLAWGGLPGSHRLPALLLVGLSGGLGGLRFLSGDAPIARTLDLLTGLFPFMELLANPHFVVGTSLLLWTLLAFASPGRRAMLAAVGLGTTLGLARPYDLVTLVVVRATAVAVTTPLREWPRRLWPLSGLAPVALYTALVLRPSFEPLASPGHPPLVDFLWALGPAAVLALSCAVRTGPPLPRDAGAHLLGWVAWGVGLILFQPFSFSMQFLAGFGAPLLILAALGLRRRPRAVTLAATALLVTNSAVAVHLALRRNPLYFAPAARYEAATAFGRACGPGDVLLAPADVGLYALGLTWCSPVVSHEAMPGYAERAAAVAAFYTSGDASSRAHLLDRLCVTALLLPGDAGLVPVAWLGEESPFRRFATVEGRPLRFSLYARDRPPACGGPGGLR